MPAHHAGEPLVVIDTPKVGGTTSINTESELLHPFASVTNKLYSILDPILLIYGLAVLS